MAVRADPGRTRLRLQLSQQSRSPGADGRGRRTAAGTVGPSVIPGVPFTAPAATPLASPPLEPGRRRSDGDDRDRSRNDQVRALHRVGAGRFRELHQPRQRQLLQRPRLSTASCPGFVIQGGDPAGDGSGGPGYTIQDEPVVGDYTRGIVAMARTALPNSAGSQFFIVLDDSVEEQPARVGRLRDLRSGHEGHGCRRPDRGRARPSRRGVDPVVMNSVTIQPGSV